MDEIFTKDFWIKKALPRAIKTFFQSFLAIVGTGAVVLSDVNWLYILSASTLAALLSICTSIVISTGGINDDSNYNK